MSHTHMELMSDYSSKALEGMDNLRELYGDIFLIVLTLIGLLLAFTGLRLFRPSIAVGTAIIFWFFRQHFIFYAKSRPLISIYIYLHTYI